MSVVSKVTIVLLLLSAIVFSGWYFTSYSSPFHGGHHQSVAMHGLDEGYLVDRPIPYDDRTVGVYDWELDGLCAKSTAYDYQTRETFSVIAKGFNTYKFVEGRRNYDEHWTSEVNCNTGVRVGGAGGHSFH